MLLQVSGFYIKYDQPDFVVGQFNVLESKVKHNTMLSAVLDVHSRLLVSFHKTEPITPLRLALEKSDDVIKSELGRLTAVLVSALEK